MKSNRVALALVCCIYIHLFASVVASCSTTVVVLGDSYMVQRNTPPPGLTNAVAVICDWDSSAALRSDGTLVGWPEPGASTSTNVGSISDACLGVNLDGTVAHCGGYFPAGLSNIVSIARSDEHALALKADGTVVAWGDEWSGATAVPAGLSDVIAIAAGSNDYFPVAHSLALRADGTVVAWGEDSDGQSTAPVGLSNVVSIAAGNWHSLALKSDGTVVAWGYNGSGQANVPAGLSNVVAISAGRLHSLALREDGTVVSWGWEPYFSALTNQLTNVVSISAGSSHSLALVGNGAPVISAQPIGRTLQRGAESILAVTAGGIGPLSYQWLLNGTNIPGATNRLLRIRAEADRVYTVSVSNSFGTVVSREAILRVVTNRPTIVEFTTNQASFAGGSTHFRVRAEGAGPLRFQWRFQASDITGATNPVLQLSNVLPQNAGEYSVIVSNELGYAAATGSLYLSTVVSWGYASNAHLQVPLGVSDIIDVAAGDYHSLALTRHRKVLAWGDGRYGRTTVPGRVTNAVSITGGGQLSVAAALDGTVSSWGAAAGYMPEGLSDVIAVAGGGRDYVWDDPHVEFALALRRDGSVVAWGYGDDSLTNVPPATTNVVGIAAGSYHALALRGDGTVVSWGSDWRGQATVPADFNRVRAVAAGLYHNLALKADGTVTAWGYNSHGQTNVPEGLSNVTAIAAGDLHSVALQRDGTIVTWGYNHYGQANVPAGLSNVVAVTAGANHTLALIGEGPPAITAQPLSRSVTRGGFSVLSVSSAGMQPLSYQWRFNGVEVPGATNDSLVIESVQPEQCGVYFVVVSNAAGVTASIAAHVSMRGLASAPSLRIELEAGQGTAVISWPAQWSDCHLEASIDMQPATWTTNSAVISRELVGDENRLRVAYPGFARFFRLVCR